MKYLFYLMFLMPIISCKNNLTVNYEAELIKSLKENNEQLNDFSRSIELDYEGKSRQPESREKAIFYLDKMKRYDTVFQNLLKTLDALKQENINTNNLKNHLISFKKNVLKIDSFLIKELKGFETAETFNCFNKNLLLNFYINKATIFHNRAINILSKQICITEVIYDN